MMYLIGVSMIATAILAIIAIARKRRENRIKAIFERMRNGTYDLD